MECFKRIPYVLDVENAGSLVPGLFLFLVQFPITPMEALSLPIRITMSRSAIHFTARLAAPIPQVPPLYLLLSFRLFAGIAFHVLDRLIQGCHQDQLA